MANCSLFKNIILAKHSLRLENSFYMTKINVCEELKKLLFSLTMVILNCILGNRMDGFVLVDTLLFRYLF